jgi:ABC-type lipoprotein export system ATPase subunit
MMTDKIYPDTGIPLPRFSKRPTKGNAWFKQVVFENTGCVRNEEMVANMGPSGSGKTSLLNVLSKR